MVVGFWVQILCVCMCVLGLVYLLHLSAISTVQNYQTYLPTAWFLTTCAHARGLFFLCMARLVFDLWVQLQFGSMFNYSWCHTVLFWHILVEIK